MSASANAVDLRTMTPKEFKKLGEPCDYKLRRIPKLRIKKADGETRVASVLKLDGTTAKSPSNYPSEGELLWDERKTEWILLEKGYVKKFLEFRNESDKGTLKTGEEVLCREKPWPVVTLREKIRLTLRSGKVSVGDEGDYIALFCANPPWYVVIPHEYLELGDYETVY